MVALPAEVAEIAKNVSFEKRNEVQAVLNLVFSGVAKMREQLDLVVVADENDKVNMKLANTIRLGVRQERLSAEKTFDAKRDDVQAKMLGYKTEDQLWLKAKQTMQILTKEIEETARWKEETKERIEAERKEVIIQDRIIKVSKFNNEVVSTEYANMSDSMFDLFLSGLEKAYNDKIEAEKKAEEERIEAERKSKLHEERKQIAIPFFEFWTDFEKSLHFGEQSESDFNNFMARIKKAKSDKDLQIEKQRKENERLKAEAEAKKLRDEKRNNELRPYIVFIRDYNKMLLLPDNEYLNEFKDIKKGAELQWDADRKEQARKAKEQEDAKITADKLAKEKAKLEAELKAKSDAEEKARKEASDKAIADQKAKAEAEKKAASAPDKEKIITAVSNCTLEMPLCKSPHAEAVANVINEKFKAFKKWAIEQTESI